MKNCTTPKLPVAWKVKTLFLSLILLLISQASYSQCPQLLWHDEFDGTTLDATKWTPQTGNGCEYGLCGWGNNELQYYTDKPTNLSVTNGNLVITARKERIQSNQYTSSKILSKNKGDFKYGRMEARMKLPTGQGMWPAFWMLSTDELYGGWPRSGEIDIMENKGSESNITYGTIHYGDAYPNNQHTGGKYVLPEGAFQDDFHVFAIEWEVNQIRWYFDGILFVTKTSSDISPYSWPFDQRFYFILNLAVGGNFGGNPDATTVFPQSLYVDYVRVYGSKLPYITGPDLVSANQTNIGYSITSVQGATYNWSVPAGATIRTGQGSSSITVDWGNTSGPLKVVITQSCGSHEYVKNIYVKPPVSYGFTLENFDDKRNINYISSDGTYQPAISNPNPSGVNTSAKVASYTRKSTVQYDVIFYGVTQITDASQYTTRKKKFFLDLYTAAPVGTLIFIQLENSSKATPTNFPTGRHSRYAVYTSKQNQWERLEFDLDAILDSSVPHNSVDRLLVLYNPNSYTGDVYYMDNLDSYNVGSVAADTQAPTAPSTLSYNSVTDSSVGLTWNASTDNVGVTAYEIFKNGVSAGSTSQTSYTASGLAANTSYTFSVKAKDQAGNVSEASNSVSVTTSGVTSYIKIEAENYATMKGVTTQACLDTDGGLNVTSIDIRDYMDYTVNIPATGTYRVDFRVASSVATGKFDLKKGQTSLVKMSVPNTGGSQAWQTISAEVKLSAGIQTLRIAATGSSFNLNWIGFSHSSATARLALPESSININVSMKVFPNPTSGKVVLESNKTIQEVLLTDDLGISKSFSVKGEVVELYVGDLKKGVYILVIRCSEGISRKKLIIN